MTAYVNSEDFKSIWRLAHEWANLDPDKTDPHDLPKPAHLNIQRLASSILNRSLRAYTDKSTSIFIDDSLTTLIFFDFRHFCKLLLCKKWGKTSDRQYLESIFVRRPNFIEWCEKEKFPAPDFWVLTQITAPHKISNRPKNEIEDKAVCRAIAMAYWDIDERIYPAHMAKSKAIQIYGNGQQYQIDTIKEWIADLDPLKNEHKGRPKNIPYKINLETGALLVEQDIIQFKK